MRFADLIAPPVRGAPLILPLTAFYARKPPARPHFERERSAFYADCARAFGWDGWRLGAPAAPALRKAGREGREREVKRGSTKNTADLDLRVSVAEFLQRGKLLDDEPHILAGDRDRALAASYGDIRRTSARYVVEIHEGLTAGILKSPDWLSEGGGGKGGARTPEEWRLAMAQAWAAVLAVAPPEAIATLRTVIIGDVYSWEVKDQDQRRQELERLREALDYAAHGLGLISRERMLARWQSARDAWILRPAIARALRRF